MNKRKIIAFLAITILLIVGAFILIGVYLLDDTKDLKPGLVEFKDDSLFPSYTVRFFDGDNISETAGVYFRIYKEYNGVNNATIEIWHEENTHLDEITLTFLDESLTYPSTISNRLGFTLPKRIWPQMEFRYTEDGRGVVFDIPECGFYGRGTMHMDFGIIRYFEDSPKEFSCYVDMQLSKDKGLKTIKYNAETSIEITIPGELILES